MVDIKYSEIKELLRNRADFYTRLNLITLSNLLKLSSFV